MHIPFSLESRPLPLPRSRHLSRAVTLLCAFVFGFSASSLGTPADSLHQLLQSAASDSARQHIYRQLSHHFIYSHPDSTRYYAQQALDIAKTIEDPFGALRAYRLLGISYEIEGQYDSSLYYFLTTLEYSLDHKDQEGQAWATNNLSITYGNLNEYEIALDYAQQSHQLLLELGDTIDAADALSSAGYHWLAIGQLDSAAQILSRAEQLLATQGPIASGSRAYNHEAQAELALEAQKPEDAIRYGEKAMAYYQPQPEGYHHATTNFTLGKAYLQLGNLRLALQFLKQAETIAKTIQAEAELMKIYAALSAWHKQSKQYPKALEYLELHTAIKDRVFTEQKAKQLAAMEAEYQFTKQNEEIASLTRDRSLKDQEISYRRQVTNILFIGLALVLCFLLIMIRNYWRSVRTNKMLEIKREEIKKKNLEIVHQKYKALRASKAKSRFLAMMSHEIRTPMNAVIGIINLLLQEQPRRDQEESLQTMKFSAENLLVLINDILDYNKIEAGKIEFESIPFEVKGLIHSLQNSLKGKALEKGIDLEIELDDQLPDYIQGDPTRIAQILTNLLSNAIKFTEKGYVRLSIELVGETDEKHHLAFTVKDTGIGISKDHLGSIFESFTQATSDITRRYGGTGLGLSITKKLVELQGSRIRVESEQGEGTEFYFSLPFGRTNLRPNLSQNRPTLPPTRDLTGVRVLIAEDNPVNELVARRFLNKWGVHVEAVADGQQAVMAVQEQSFDLILMDLQMPVMDGFKATRKIRSLANQSFRSLPIIALTASAMNEIRHKAFDAGVTDFIAKPFNPEELRAVLEKYVLHDDPELIDEQF